MYNHTLFIFRRDLRWQDNTALHHSLQNSSKVSCSFFLDPKQLNKDINPYFSNNAVQFMMETLTELNNEHSIHFFEGNPSDLLSSIVKNNSIDHICFNMDYTPYSKLRDQSIQDLCKKLNIECTLLEDALLHPITDLLKDDGTPYLVYTPFYRAISKKNVKDIIDYSKLLNKINNKKLKGEINKPLSNFYLNNELLFVHGGRKNALDKMNLLKNFKDYNNIRNDMTKNTTNLSAYIKFGILSIREIYFQMKKLGLEDIIRELYWREFYYAVGYYLPHIFGQSMKDKYKNIHWDNNESWIQKWKTGNTGYPLVDAGIRQLLTTGYMHNRARMVVAMFFTKDMHCDWRIGEQFFAQHLVDYDPMSNNGGWQWSASTGADSVPYFRIMNPTLQLKRFDPTCEYVKKWIPELKDLTPKQIIDWVDKQIDNVSYVKPILKHSDEVKKTLEIYKNIE